MRQVTVVGNIVSKNGVTLFLADGTSEVLSSESFKTLAIMEKILPDLAKGSSAKVDLDAFTVGGTVEKLTNGRVKMDDKGVITLAGQNLSIATDGALTDHFEQAAVNNNAKGLKNFLLALGEVVKERKHTADELLAFMKGADLPIADDGCLIGYKVLIHQDGKMVDPHSRRIPQMLGSLVYMPNSKVDDDRRVACSTGLHIAARSYLSGFWGRSDSRLCLVKIKPGDVIAVPLGEVSKMRVSAYHIVKVFDDADANRIVHGTPIDSLPNAARMLADAVAGNHPAILQRVEITIANATNANKGDIKVTDLEKPAEKRKARPHRKVLGKPSVKTTVKSVKDAVAKNLPYDKKLARAQKDYDAKMSIRDIAKKYHMDRETLGKKLKRAKGR